MTVPILDKWDLELLMSKQKEKKKKENKTNSDFFFPPNIIAYATVHNKLDMTLVTNFINNRALVTGSLLLLGGLSIYYFTSKGTNIYTKKTHPQVMKSIK